jgi:hypothetical protein
MHVGEDERVISYETHHLDFVGGMLREDERLMTIG